jgi:hypothetical protein
MEDGEIAVGDGIEDRCVGWPHSWWQLLHVFGGQDGRVAPTVATALGGWDTCCC